MNSLQHYSITPKSYYSFNHYHTTKQTTYMMSDSNEHMILSNLEKLPAYILVDNIMSYVSIDNLVNLSSCNKYFRTLLFHSTSAIHIWNSPSYSHPPFEICIDGYCPLCQLTRKKGSYDSAISVLSKIPVKFIRIHCFITDVPHCLEAIGNRGEVEQLELQLTNRSNSPTLETLLRSSETLQLSSIKDKYSKLRHLVLDSSHLQHVNCGGRDLLLELFGANLTYLSFVGLSMSNAFRIISRRCPNLIKLRVDRAQCPYDLLDYENSNLAALEICRTNFVLPSISLPNLSYLRYSPSFCIEHSQLETTIASIPTSIRKLHLEIPSSYANDTLFGISRRLPHLECLTLEGSYEMGNISGSSLIQLGINCPKLYCLELVSLKSVTVIGFEPQAFIQLRSLSSLKILRVMYQDSVLLFLPNLLRNHETLREVILWHRKHWFDTIHWVELEAIVKSTRESFPQVHLLLEEFQSN